MRCSVSGSFSPGSSGPMWTCARRTQAASAESGATPAGQGLRMSPASFVSPALSVSPAHSSRTNPAGSSPVRDTCRPTCIPTCPPSSSAPETRLMSWGFEMTRPRRAAHSSMAKTPRTSVAVVTTDAAPTMRAMRHARSFAPPTWPLSSDIAHLPASSTHTTAGSCILLATYGATARTAMPQAPTKTMPSQPCAKASPVHAPTLSKPGRPASSAMRCGAQARAPSSSLAIFWARTQPFAVNPAMAIWLMRAPCRAGCAGRAGSAYLARHPVPPGPHSRCLPAFHLRPFPRGSRA